MLHTLRIITLSLSLALFTISASAQSGTGIISGTVVDGETGETVISAAVTLEGTGYGAMSDLDGAYRLEKVKPGTYTLVCAMIGYAETKITDVKVVAGKMVKLDIKLMVEALQMQEVVIRAQAVQNTEASLLKDRQKAAAMSDAVSAETMSRSGSSNAADAMKKVTGATVTDGGKTVVVRGLGDRYSNTQLNGSDLPSSNPYKKSVPLDLFPSTLLDNIVTVKTFTPDKPGNFSGGTVDISTKAYPETFTLSVSASTSYEPGVSLNDGVLTYEGGKNDWVAMDDGKRGIPSALSDPNVNIPDISSAHLNRETAYELDRLSRSFNSVMAPKEGTGPLNQSYSVSVGNQVKFLNRPFGYLGSLSYSRSLSFYDDGRVAKWNLPNKAENNANLVNLYDLKDSRSTDDVLWGGLLTLSWKPHPKHDLGVTLIQNRNAENTARYLNGPYPEQLEDSIYETRVLNYTERGLKVLQLRGRHVPGGLRGTRIEWKGSIGSSFQDEPDFRLFNSTYRDMVVGGASTRVYMIPTLNRPTRYFRDLDDSQQDGSVDISVPFTQWSGQQSSLKFGGLFSHSERTFRERRFQYILDSKTVKYTGDPYLYFAQTGIIDSTGTLTRFGNYIVEPRDLSSNYDGEQDIAAFYGMVDLPLTNRLRFITGARFESTDIHVASQDTTKKEGNLTEEDILPSANLVYQISENMNVRAAYGRTLARPTLRELAPYASFDFYGAFTFIGNPDLKRTIIDNFDVRWEWFARPGEIYAVSMFYKDFIDPIERAISPFFSNGEASFINVDEAIVYGAEFELRKNLDQITPRLKNFQAGGNISLIHSEVDVPPAEYKMRQVYYDNPPKTRKFTGQSPYVVNLDFSYDNRESGNSISLNYNVFGERLSTVSQGGTPDVYEQPMHLLNLTFSHAIRNGLTLKGYAKNLLNSDSRRTHKFEGREFVYEEYSTGRTFSIGLTYSLK